MVDIQDLTMIDPVKINRRRKMQFNRYFGFLFIVLFLFSVCLTVYAGTTGKSSAQKSAAGGSGARRMRSMHA